MSRPISIGAAIIFLVTMATTSSIRSSISRQPVSPARQSASLASSRTGRQSALSTGLHTNTQSGLRTTPHRSFGQNHAGKVSTQRNFFNVLPGDYTSLLRSDFAHKAHHEGLKFLVTINSETLVHEVNRGGSGVTSTRSKRLVRKPEPVAVKDAKEKVRGIEGSVVTSVTNHSHVDNIASNVTRKHVTINSASVRRERSRAPLSRAAVALTFPGARSPQHPDGDAAYPRLPATAPASNRPSRPQRTDCKSSKFCDRDGLRQNQPRIQFPVRSKTLIQHVSTSRGQDGIRVPNVKTGRHKRSARNVIYINEGNRQEIVGMVSGFRGLGLLSGVGQNCLLIQEINEIYGTDGRERITLDISVRITLLDDEVDYVTTGVKLQAENGDVCPGQSATTSGDVTGQLAARGDVTTPPGVTGNVTDTTSFVDAVIVVRVTELSKLDGAANVSDYVDMERNVTYTAHGVEKSEGAQQLTQTQILVISTCSAVVGFFFLMAAVLRVRNYLKRIRNAPQAERPPDFRSCTANLRQNNWITNQPVRRESKGKLDKKQTDDGDVTPPLLPPAINNKPRELNGNNGRIGKSAESRPLLASGPDVGDQVTHPNSVLESSISDKYGEHHVSIVYPHDDDTTEASHSFEESAPLVVPPFLEDIAELSESSSSAARRSISIAEEIVQRHEHWKMVCAPREIKIDVHENDITTLNEDEDIIQEGVGILTNAGYDDSESLTVIGHVGLAQSDSIGSMNYHPYNYGNQSEYVPEVTIAPAQTDLIIETFFANSAYSPTEVLESPVSWLGGRDAVIDACMIPYELENESEIERGKSTSSETDSDNGKVGESPGLITSTSSESSDVSPMERLQRESDLSYITTGWSYGSFTDGLNEIDDELFVDEILQIEGCPIQMADLSEFSSLPTIPESSRENTDADDESDSRPETARKASWVLTPSSPEKISQLQNILVQCLSETTVSTGDNQNDKLSNGIEPNFYENDVDLSEGDILSEGDDDATPRFMDERTLLLSSFEGMESTLV